jgi:sugar phosphate isomerase/epimerase
MHIEETDSPAAFREAKKWTKHIHLADNTRMEPGSGDIDFVSSFKVLKRNGFKGFMAYECGVTGDNPKQQAKNLAKSLDYVRDCIAKV